MEAAAAGEQEVTKTTEGYCMNRPDFRSYREPRLLHALDPSEPHQPLGLVATDVPSLLQERNKSQAGSDSRASAAGVRKSTSARGPRYLRAHRDARHSGGRRLSSRAPIAGSAAAGRPVRGSSRRRRRCRVPCGIGAELGAARRGRSRRTRPRAGDEHPPAADPGRGDRGRRPRLEACADPGCRPE